MPSGRGGWDIEVVIAVVVGVRSNVPTVDGMGSEQGPVGGFFVD